MALTPVGEPGRTFVEAARVVQRVRPYAATVSIQGHHRDLRVPSLEKSYAATEDKPRSPGIFDRPDRGNIPERPWL
jgi:hypothetical protein